MIYSVSLNNLPTCWESQCDLLLNITNPYSVFVTYTDLSQHKYRSAIGFTSYWDTVTFNQLLMFLKKKKYPLSTCFWLTNILRILAEKLLRDSISESRSESKAGLTCDQEVGSRMFKWWNSASVFYIFKTSIHFITLKHFFFFNCFILGQLFISTVLNTLCWLDFVFSCS